MNKDFILKYLKREHLEGNDALMEIADESGLDIVKLLLRNHESLQLYIPKISSFPQLVNDVLKENQDKLSKKQLQDIIGMTRRRLDEYLKNIENTQPH